MGGQPGAVLPPLPGTSHSPIFQLPPSHRYRLQHTRSLYGGTVGLVVPDPLADPSLWTILFSAAPARGTGGISLGKDSAMDSVDCMLGVCLRSEALCVGGRLGRDGATEHHVQASTPTAATSTPNRSTSSSWHAHATRFGDVEVKTSDGASVHLRSLCLRCLGKHSRAS